MKRAVWILLAAVLVGCSSPSGKSAGLVAAPPADPAPKAEAPAAAPAVVPNVAEVAKVDATGLYPAYILVQQQQRKWGYVDGTGTFVIPASFDSAEEFSAQGLAVVSVGGKYGLIDKTGKAVLDAVYFGVGPVSPEGDRVFLGEKTNTMVDAQGKVVPVTGEVKDGFSEGLAPFATGGRWGYIDRIGAVAIPAQFQSAGAFAGGKALVRLDGNTSAVIDKAGNRLVTLSYQRVERSADDLLLVGDANWKLGYVALDGSVLFPPQFSDAHPFEDGLAVVNRAADFVKAEFGVLNRQGEWVIPAQYGYIQSLGGGLFAVAERVQTYVPTSFMPMAIFNAQGKQVTDFRFYDVQKVDKGLISVSDETETYFLDATGARAKGLPAVAGAGSLKLVGDLVRADVDQSLSYLTRQGKAVWQIDRSVELAGGLKAVAKKFRPDRSTVIYYPELTGLSDAKAQAAINARLKAIFVDPHAQKAPAASGEKEMAITLTEMFGAQQLGHLLIINEQGYAYPVGAAHGMPISNYYHFDTTTGQEYKLADLFKPGAPYPERLTAWVRAEIAREPEKYLNQKPDVLADHTFTVTKDGLVIYFDPYEVASYAQGFMRFPVPWSELTDLLDVSGAFWKAFH